MHTVDLGTLLSGQVFVFMIVFTRLSGAIMNFPGIGESFVPMNVRLAFALVLSVLLYPVLAPQIGTMPDQVPSLALMIGKELLIGLFFGLLLRTVMGVVETTGALISVETGLSNAMILNPTQATQSALPSAFLGVAGTALLFITGMDHFLLQGIVDTYRVFPVHGALVLGDMSNGYAHLVSDTFRVGIELAAPFMIMGLLLYVVLGMIQRMMPQVQLFLVVLPLQIWGGLLFFGATVGIILGFWLRYYDHTIGALLLR